MSSPAVVANPAGLNSVLGGATTTLVILHRKLSMIVTLSLSNLGVNLRVHAQLESIRTNGECNNKLTVNVVDIVLKLSKEIRILR